MNVKRISPRQSTLLIYSLSVVHLRLYIDLGFLLKLLDHSVVTIAVIFFTPLNTPNTPHLLERTPLTNYCIELQPHGIIQESRAVARKPRDAEPILFGLMFANQQSTNFTKQKRLCLKADLNGLYESILSM